MVPCSTSDRRRRKKRHCPACIVILLFAAFGVSGCGAKVAAPSGKFHEGRDALMHGRFDEAIAALNEHLKRHPQGELAARATFLIGKCHLGKGDFTASERWFEKTIQQFPATEEAHKAKYKIAIVKLLTGDAVDAESRFESLAQEADGPYTPEAVAMAKYLSEAEPR